MKHVKTIRLLQQKISFLIDVQAIKKINSDLHTNSCRFLS